MTLLDNGWSGEQAQGLLDRLQLVGGTPDWKPEHLKRLRDWCSAHEKDHITIEGQLEFIAYELCNSYESMGMALKQATTVDEARRAVEPYVRLLREDREWWTKPRR
jgi:hypothetical protein